MNLEQQGYYFNIIPQYLQAKGFIVDKTLPQFSLSIFIAHHKVDQIAIVPVKEQKLYHTVFWLATQKLGFILSFTQEQWELVKVQVHDGSKFMGRVFLNCKQYVKELQQQKQHYHCEKARISEDYQLQFQLFVASSRQELDNLLRQYYGESDIKTPLTKQSQERLKEELDFNIDNIKISQSEIYLPNAEQTKKSIFQRIDEEESVNSSVPQTYPNYRISPLRIQLKQVEGQEQRQKQHIFSSNQLRKLNNLNWREALSLYFFGLVSLVMIYFSMIPIKRL